MSLAAIDQSLTVLENIRQWGGLNSDAILDPHCEIFTHPDVEGLIGHRVAGQCAVVFGDPVCSPADREKLVEAFHSQCKAQNKKIVYVMASEEFARWSLNRTCGASIEFGEELLLDPREDNLKGAKASLLRRKIKRAIKENVIAREYLDSDLTLEAALEKVNNSWVKNRRGPQVYISHIHLFTNRLGKRWFYAEQDGKVIGVVMLSQLKARGGWLLNRLMVTPDAPHGTSELLVSSAVETLKRENCSFLTVGTVPKGDLGEIVGFGKFSTWFKRKMFSIAKRLLHLEGRKKYWEKFQMESKPSYILLSEPHIGWGEIKGLMNAMNVSL